MTTEWRVLSMECLANEAGLTDVVYKINWLCYATINSQDGATQGFVVVEYNPDVPYTPFNQLTQNQVLDWVYPILGVNGVAQAEAQAIAIATQKANPTIVAPPLPWS
jgi:hypothetical protein